MLKPARRLRTRRTRRSSRNWCDVADWLSPMSCARSQTHSSPCDSKVEHAHACGVTERAEDLGERVHRRGADERAAQPGHARGIDVEDVARLDRRGGRAGRVQPSRARPNI